MSSVHTSTQFQALVLQQIQDYLEIDNPNSDSSGGNLYNVGAYVLSYVKKTVTSDKSENRHHIALSLLQKLTTPERNEFDNDILVEYVRSLGTIDFGPRLASRLDTNINNTLQAWEL
jgi:hypothetical protein